MVKPAMDRGDGVLVGLVGLLLSGISLGLPGIFGCGFCGTGLILLAVGIIMYVAARPPVWAPPLPTGTPLPPPNCPICGRILAWVDEQKRWYCPQCQAYR